MAEIVHMPERLPEGWEPSSMFAGAFVRYVSLLPGWAPETIRAQPFVEGAILLLVVEHGEGGWTANTGPRERLLATFSTRNEAISAVELAYCNCKIRKERA